MKRSAPGILIAALLLLSVGYVWQQRRMVASPAAEVGEAAMAHTPVSVPPGESSRGGLPPASTAGAKVDPAAPPLPSLSQKGPLNPIAPRDAAEFHSALPVNTMPLEPLISQAGKQSLIARDGTPVRIELSPGQPASAVEFQAWTDEQARNAEGHYDWRFKIKVAEGKLVERLDASVFVAPEAGYRLEFDYAMTRDLPGKDWRNSLSKSFFIHFNNDTYGLLNVQMVAGGAHFVTIKAYLNPAAGSRNLQPPPPPPVMRR